MTGLGRDFVPTPTPGTESDELEGERLLWLDGRLRALDPLASVVWGLFDGRASIGELARDLAGAFGASEAIVEADVERLCLALLDEGYIFGSDLLPRNPSVPTGAGQAGLGPRVGLTPLPTAGDRLEQIEWVYRSDRYCALSHEFGIRTNDLVLGRYLERRLAIFASAGEPAHRYSVVDTGIAGAARFETYFDQAGLSCAPDRDLVVRHLLWHVNQEVVQRDESHLLVHAAGAVTEDGLAIALPGSMNAGKSTLVAGLVRCGFAYLTDELLALDVSSGLIDPYPRALNLGKGSWDVLPDLEPTDWDPEDPVPRGLWHVDAGTLGTVARSAPLGFIVIPRFERDARSTLTPISQGEAAEVLYRHAFNSLAWGVVGYRAVVAVAAVSRCARLRTGSLTEAVELVREFTGP